jgi:hypothetical protein
MAFWKKRIELPAAFYKTAGECFLCYVESATLAQKLGFRKEFDATSGLTLGRSTSMTFKQAYALLDLVENCSVQLRSLLNEFPMKSGSSLEVREKALENTIQSCREMKNAISAIPHSQQSLPIRQHVGLIGGDDAVRFEHLVVTSAEWLGVEQATAAKAMAKAINVSDGEFTQLAAQAVRDTPRGRLVWSAWTEAGAST